MSTNRKNLDQFKQTDYNAVDNQVPIDVASQLHWEVSNLLCEKLGVNESGHCPVDFVMQDKTRGEYPPIYVFENMQRLLDQLSKAKILAKRDPKNAEKLRQPKNAYENIELAIQADVRNLSGLLGWVHAKLESRVKMLEFIQVEQETK